MQYAFSSSQGTRKEKTRTWNITVGEPEIDVFLREAKKLLDICDSPKLLGKACFNPGRGYENGCNTTEQKLLNPYQAPDKRLNNTLQLLYNVSII